MLSFWARFGYSLPAPINSTIDVALQWLGAAVSRRFSNTPLEHWLLTCEGRTTTFFAVLMVLALIWFMVLYISSYRRPESPSRVVRAPLADEQANSAEMSQVLMAVAQSEADIDAHSMSTSPVQPKVEKATPLLSLFAAHPLKKDVTAGHYAVNDSRASLPVRFTPSLALPMDYTTPASLFNSIETPHTPLFEATKKAPWKTPQVAASFLRPLGTAASFFSSIHKQATSTDDNDSASDSLDDDYRAKLMDMDFSNMKKKWPTSFAVSVESGDLHEKGTPTKKFVDRMVLKKRMNKYGSPGV